MKFRTDFVTNSSSSNFSVSIVLTTDAGEFSELLDLDDGNGQGAADLKCTPEDILKAGSVAELMELLRNAACDCEDEDDDVSGWINALAKAIGGKVTSLEQIQRIRLIQHLSAWGECASCLIWNDEDLQKLAAEVCETGGEAHEEALKAMQNYLKKESEYYEPSGFMGGNSSGKYAWEGSLEDLAELICSNKISPNDEADEVVDIDMVNKTVKRYAEYKLMPR